MAVGTADNDTTPATWTSLTLAGWERSAKRKGNLWRFVACLNVWHSAETHHKHPAFLKCQIPSYQSYTENASLTHSLTHSLLTYSLTHYLLTSYLPTYSLNHLLTQSLTHFLLSYLLLTCLLTHSITRLFEKLTGSQLVKKFPVFYGTR